MDAIEMLKDLRQETSKAVTRIAAEIGRTLMKRARKEADVIKVVEAWKRAARKTKHL